MPTPATSPLWRKAIPESRDRLQSRILVWTVVPLISIPCLGSIALYLPNLVGCNCQISVLEALIPSLAFAVLAWRLRAATAPGALCGGIICYQITFSTGLMRRYPWQSGLVPLIALFVLTFAATRAGRGRKTSAGLAESRTGRSASQVVANIGLAGLLAVMSVLLIDLAFHHARLEIASDTVTLIMVLAALAEATADTVSSEIGQAFGGTPILLTTLRRVAPGTDGAITLLGTLAGIAAAAIIAVTGIPAMGMSPTECAVAFAAGVAGLFFDSLLGATVEAKGWIGNDFVNFFSTAFAAAVSLAAIRYAQPILLR